MVTGGHFSAHIQFIAANAFKWTPRLKHIDLEKNGLKHLDANLFRSMPNLYFLNVGKNLLNTFEVDRDRFMVERFLNESSVLFIHGKETNLQPLLISTKSLSTLCRE